MLNSIKKHLDSENEYRQILTNSWELSILRSPEETLIKVIEEIVDELVQDLPDDAFKAKIKSTASSFIKGAVRNWCNCSIRLKEKTKGQKNRKHNC